MRPIDLFYLSQEEPDKSCLQFLRTHILQTNAGITEAWKYGMPFFCFKDRAFCYLWVHKKFRQPYIGIVNGNRIDHPALLAEKRARMKILLLDPKEDLPLKTIDEVLAAALSLL